MRPRDGTAANRRQVEAFHRAALKAAAKGAPVRNTVESAIKDLRLVTQLAAAAI
jgi:hypothetical protein